MRASKRVFTSLILVSFFMIFSAYSLGAYAVVDNEEVTLKIVYSCDGVQIPDAGFKIYYVADMNRSCNFMLAGDFKDYPVNVNLKTEEYRSLAQTLYGYALIDGIKPTDSGYTDSQGELVFSSSTGNLKQGMYLVTSDEVVFGGCKYTSEPYLISLPLFDSDTKSFEYYVTSYPKSEFEEFDTDSSDITDTDTSTDSDTDTQTDTDSDSDSEGLTEISVLKKWNDKGNEYNRPKSVTVTLLENGTVYDTVELNESNNWYHTWYNLNSKSEWLVTETPVQNYTALVMKEGSTFIVTNTKCDTSSDTDSDYDTEPSPSTDGSANSTPTLPQTGTLWWAVPILFASGLAIFFVGCLIRRGTDDEK